LTAVADATPVLVATTVAAALPLEAVDPETDEVTLVTAPVLPALAWPRVSANKAAAATTV